MALKKQKEYKGFSADYWRPIAWANHVDRDQTVVDMVLYKDRAARDADKLGNVLESKQVVLSLVDGDRKAIYQAIKKQKTVGNDGTERDGYFVDAIDILENEK